MRDAKVTKRTTDDAERVAVERKQETQERERRSEKHADRSATIDLLRLSDPCRRCCTFAGICSIPQWPSAAGWDSTVGIAPDTDATSNRTAEIPDPLFSYEELLDALQSADTEQFADILREVSSEVEANLHRSNEQVSLESCSRYVIAWCIAFPSRTFLIISFTYNQSQSFVNNRHAYFRKHSFLPSISSW